jgi:hypothetical protein
MAAPDRTGAQGHTGTAVLAHQAQQDPLNLHEYMMSDARTPKLEQLMHPSPTPSAVSGNSPQILSGFAEYPKSVPSAQRSYPGGFSNTFDSNQISSPTSATSAYGLLHQAQNTSDHRSRQNPMHRQKHSLSSLTDSSPHLDGQDPNDTSEGGRGYGIQNSREHIGSGSPAKATDCSSERDAGSGKSKKSGGKDTGDDQPPWSELRTKAGKERKRLPLACIACRRKKIRCSGEKPACKHCLRSRIPCVYKITTRKAAPRTDYMAMLDKRLKRMEERVIRLIPKESQPAVPRAVVKPALPPQSAKATNTKRAADEAFGPDADLEKWSKSRQASKVDVAPPIKGQDPEEKGLLTEGADSLPSMEIQQHLAEVYFDYVYGQAYPLLHKPSFMRRLAAGTAAPVLVLAVCAVSARFSNHPKVRTEPAFLRGEDWARAAREISLKRYDTPNITILIVYLLLGLHEFGTCQGGRSWMLAGMAQRMAFALLLHKDLDHNGWGSQRRSAKEKKDQSQLSPTDREIRRRTMWACFLMDRFNASGTDRPMQMTEDFVRIPLPIKEQYFQMELSGPTETLDGVVPNAVEPDTGQMADAKQNMGTSAYYIRLVSIWGKSVHYWNLGGRDQEKFPMWSHQSEFSILREKIRSFHETLPESMRWNPGNLQNHASEKTANQFVFVHLVYYQLLLFMNRFALPYSGFARPSMDMPQQFHTEAARSAIEAANQVSLLIKEAIEYNVTAPFAGYCAFYSSTVHISGVFSNNPRVEAVAKQNLAYNVKFLTKMKKYWGMFHFVSENLKELYRQHADASLRGPVTAKKEDQILQYGDWFDRYPHGVSQTDYEDPAGASSAEPGTDAVLGQKSDLQSVEEFFATLSPPSKAAELRKQAKKAKSRKAAQKNAVDKNLRDDITSPALPQQIQEDQLGLPQNSMDSSYNNPYLNNNPITNFNSADLSLLNNTNPLVQPGMLSQLDRHLVLSSYAGMDLTTANSISNTMNEHNSSNQSNLDAYAQNNVPDLWNMDFNGMGGNYGGVDASTAWFMPFNLDPPDVNIGDDAGFSVGALMGQGVGGFDFGGLGDGMVVDHGNGLGGSGGVDQT